MQRVQFYTRTFKEQDGSTCAVRWSVVSDGRGRRLVERAWTTSVGSDHVSGAEYEEIGDFAYRQDDPTILRELDAAIR